MTASVQLTALSHFKARRTKCRGDVYENIQAEHPLTQEHYFPSPSNVNEACLPQALVEPHISRRMKHNLDFVNQILLILM